MFPNSDKGYGLGLLPPWLRLILVIAVTSSMVMIDRLDIAIAAIFISFILILLNKKVVWPLLVPVIFTIVLVFLGNLVFSPAQEGSISWWVFTINQQGALLGAIRGIRMGAMMLMSFAWLFTTSLPEMYKGLEWIKPAREWALGILRGIQIAEKEFTILTQSLVMRGLKWDSLIANLKNLIPLASGIVPMVIDNTQKAAFASQSHRHSPEKGNGTVDIGQLFVRYSSDQPDVIKNVSLSVSAGEFVYLAGKCKAGKTTLLRTMGGMIPWIMGEHRGRVMVSGYTTHELPLENLSGISRYVAPDPFASIYGLTVGQEISYIAGNKAAAEKALEIMKIRHLWDRETTKLSGGQQVRLVLAGALASEAKLLLLDSPMQELDPQGRADFMEALQILRTKGDNTIVIADPFWPDLVKYTDRVLVLEQGELIEDLKPGVFFTDPWLSRCNLDIQATNHKQHITPGNVIAEMKDVHVELGGNKILKGLNFHLREGELVAIVGPNGSGKTTAMLTLAGAVKHSSGEVIKTDQVGYVFQNAKLQTVTMSVRDELSFGPKIMNWSEDKMRSFIEASADWTGLSLDMCPLDLHAADIRLLAIAAVNTCSKILILDEPTVGLDSWGIRKVSELIQDLRKQGTAIIIITHDRDLAASADRTVVICDGVVQEEWEGQKVDLTY